MVANNDDLSLGPRWAIGSRMNGTTDIGKSQHETGKAIVARLQVGNDEGLISRFPYDGTVNAEKLNN